MIWGFIFLSPAFLLLKMPSRCAKLSRKVPLEKIFVETDSPYLTPVPHRGKRNEPAYVRFVAETIATVKNVDLATVAQATSANVKNLFCI